MDKFTAGVDGLPHLLEHYYFGFDEAERVDEAVLLKQLASLKPEALEVLLKKVGK